MTQMEGSIEWSDVPHKKHGAAWIETRSGTNGATDGWRRAQQIRAAESRVVVWRGGYVLRTENKGPSSTGQSHVERSIL